MKYLGFSVTSVKYFGTTFISEFNLRLKLIIESQFRTSRGKVFHSLMVEGRKELKYCVVRECIVRMLCALRRLYKDCVSTVGCIKEQRYKGDRLLNIL